MIYTISTISVKDINYINLFGDSNYLVNAVSNIENTNFKCLSFYSGDDINYVKNIESGILLIKNGLSSKFFKFKSKCVLVCDNPKYRFAEVLNKKYNNDQFELKTQNLNYISDKAEIHNNCLLAPNITIFDNVEINKNCRIQSGTIIGANGLGDIKFEGVYYPFPHFGKVIIEEDVHIGCNVSIMRGILEDTIIRKGTRIANNVCIGHSASIGSNCYISSGVCIGGATKIEDDCWVSIGATVTDNVTIQKNTMLGAGSVLVNNTLPNSFYLGNPARKINERE